MPTHTRTLTHSLPLRAGRINTTLMKVLFCFQVEGIFRLSGAKAELDALRQVWLLLLPGSCCNWCHVCCSVCLEVCCGTWFSLDCGVVHTV
jgi:hypothetical protein